MDQKIIYLSSQIRMKNKKLPLQKIVDRVLGEPILLFLGAKKSFSKQSANESYDKVLIYKLDAIGDAVLSLPMIKAIKENNRKTKILVVCSASNFPVFDKQEFIEKVIVLDSEKPSIRKIIQTIKVLKKEGADFAVDTGQSANISAIMSSLTARKTSGFFKKRSLRNKVHDHLTKIDSSKHMVFNYLDLIKNQQIKNETNLQLVKLKYNSSDLKKVESLVGSKKNLIGIHPCTLMSYKSQSKAWPKKKYAEVINHLVNSGEKVIIIGSPSETKAVNKLMTYLNEKTASKIINLSGKLNLPQTFALMTKLKLFIANDGGIMHVGAAMGVPTLGIFGLETPIRYGPFNNKSEFVFHPNESRPLESISVEEVLEKIEKMLKG